MLGEGVSVWPKELSCDGGFVLSSCKEMPESTINALDTESKFTKFTAVSTHPPMG